MKAKPNILVIFSAFTFLFISFVFDNWDLSLRRYAGQTFDFSLTIPAQLGITLVFTLLLVGLVLIALVYREPDRWVYYVALIVTPTVDPLNPSNGSSRRLCLLPFEKNSLRPNSSPNLLFWNLKPDFVLGCRRRVSLETKKEHLIPDGNCGWRVEAAALTDELAERIAKLNQTAGRVN